MRLILGLILALLSAGPALAAPIHENGGFPGTGGVNLYQQAWRPQGPIKAVLVVMHGLRDHSDRYGLLAETLTAKGYAVYAFDIRGHGKSAGQRVWVESFDDYVADFASFVEEVRVREAGKPIFLFGHSMGGAIVTLYTLGKHPAISGVVLSAPALMPGSNVSPFLIGMTGFLGRVAPGLPVLELKSEDFSRDPKVVAAMDADPLIEGKPGPARTAAELLGALGRIQTQVASLDVPVLALHGSADRVTNPEGSKQLVQRAMASDKTLKVYDGAFHDLLHEPERDQVLADISGWLDAR